MMFDTTFPKPKSILCPQCGGQYFSITTAGEWQCNSDVHGHSMSLTIEEMRATFEQGQPYPHKKRCGWKGVAA
jgi:hypothetical protein